jgi:hypothetical protein
MPSQGPILAGEAYNVEHFRYRSFVKSTIHVLHNLIGPIEDFLGAFLHEVVLDFGFINAHRERSRELRYPSQQRVE